LQICDGGTQVIHSDPPGYKTGDGLSAIANQVVAYAHIITDNVPEAADGPTVPTGEANFAWANSSLSVGKTVSDRLRAFQRRWCSNANAVAAAREVTPILL
jgi:hypothetical protein